MVELAHEQLATQWNRYQRWLRRSDDDPLRAEDKRALDRLMDRTERWAELGCRDRDLSLGGDLDDFSALCERRELWASPLERDFVRRSLEAREQRLQEEADRRAYEQQVLQAQRVSESLRLAMEAQQAAVREPTTACRLAWEAVLWDRNELSEGVFRESLDRLPAPVKVIARSEGGKLSAGYGDHGSFIFAASYEASSIATWRSDGARLDASTCLTKDLGPSRPRLDVPPCSSGAPDVCPCSTWRAVLLRVSPCPSGRARDIRNPNAI